MYKFSFKNISISKLTNNTFHLATEGKINTINTVSAESFECFRRTECNDSVVDAARMMKHTFDYWFWLVPYKLLLEQLSIYKLYNRDKLINSRVGFAYFASSVARGTRELLYVDAIRYNLNYTRLST